MTSPFTPLRLPEHERPPTEQMLPEDAALASPSAARWLKLLSLRPPVSVTRPILNDFAVPPVVVLPQAATTNRATITSPTRRTFERTTPCAPFNELDSVMSGSAPSSFLPSWL